MRMGNKSQSLWVVMVLARSMGTIVDLLSDEKGIVWPESVAPYKVHLVALNTDDAEVKDYAEGIYASFKDKVEILFDDRDARAGEICQ